MVLGKPPRASPSSPASSSGRVRAALCPILFIPCASAPTARLAPASGRPETRSAVSGGGDAGGGGGEDGPPPFVSFFLFFPSPDPRALVLTPAWRGSLAARSPLSPAPAAPPPRKDFPQRWRGLEPRLLRPAREGLSITLGVGRAGGSARPRGGSGGDPGQGSELRERTRLTHLRRARDAAAA